MIDITTTSFITPIFHTVLEGESGLIPYKEQPYYGNQVRSDLQNLPPFKRLCEAIQGFIRCISLEAHGHKDQYEYEVTQMWITVLEPGESFHPHSHPNSYWGGVFFLEEDESFPPVVFKNPIKNQLCLAREKETAINADSITVPYLKDRLVIFPAYITHYVPINKSPRDRVSLSFNILPRGQYDEPESLAWVRI